MTLLQIYLGILQLAPWACIAMLLEFPAAAILVRLGVLVRDPRRNRGTGGLVLAWRYHGVRS